MQRDFVQAHPQLVLTSWLCCSALAHPRGQPTRGENAVSEQVGHHVLAGGGHQVHRQRCVLMLKKHRAPPDVRCCRHCDLKLDNSERISEMLLVLRSANQVERVGAAAPHDDAALPALQPRRRRRTDGAARGPAHRLQTRLARPGDSLVRPPPPDSGLLLLSSKNCGRGEAWKAALA